MAKKIEGDETLKKELEAIIAGLPEDLREKMKLGAAAAAAAEYVKSPDLTEEDELQIRRVLQ